MARPKSLNEIARRTNDSTSPFDIAVREFLDNWQTMTRERRAHAINQEPQRTGVIQDAYLGAIAEHLALSFQLPVPAWTEQPIRFLREPFFSGGLESLKASQLAESPLAFRRRLIFISRDGLSRPRRIETDVLV
jgi:hypothetical protein